MSLPRPILIFRLGCISISLVYRSPRLRNSTRRLRLNHIWMLLAVSVHIGSQITNVGSFHAAIERVADLVRHCANRDTTFVILTLAAVWEFPTKVFK